MSQRCCGASQKSSFCAFASCRLARSDASLVFLHLSVFPGDDLEVTFTANSSCQSYSSFGRSSSSYHLSEVAVPCCAVTRIRSLSCSCSPFSSLTRPCQPPVQTNRKTDHSIELFSSESVKAIRVILGLRFLSLQHVQHEMGY